MKQAAILFLVSIFFSPQAAFIESYQHGKIVVQPEFEFGAKTNWLSIFYEDIFPQLICRGSGEIYVSHPKQNKIFQLDSQGNVTRTFGKGGQGPGDLDSPSQLSILDDRFLVVQERLRISLFDLEGRFVKIIKTRFPPRQTVALQKGIIAYVADRYDVIKIQKSVRMIDSTSGREMELKSFQLNHENEKKYFFNAFADDVIIQRTGDGKLLVGHTGAAEVNIYSITGEREGNIKLRINPTKASPKLKEEFFGWFFRTIDRIGFSGYGDKQVNMRNRSKYFFPPCIPYFQDIKIDGEGNILVFRYQRYSEKSIFEFQVYTARGEYVCDSLLDMGYIVLPRNKLDYYIFQGFRFLGFSVLRDKADDFSGLKLLRGSLENPPLKGAAALLRKGVKGKQGPPI